MSTAAAHGITHIATKNYISESGEHSMLFRANMLDCLDRGDEVYVLNLAIRKKKIAPNFTNII